MSAPNRDAAGRPKTEPASLTLSARPFETRWIELGSDASQLELGEAVRDGLGGARKTLPSRFFYDEEGSRLFEEICELPEYYLTRAETEILAEIASDLARKLPEIRAIVELGSGSAVKTEYLLRAFEGDGRALCFAPIDVSRSALEESIERLERKHPKLEILPAIAEYDAGLAEIHALGREPKLTLWLGSSIGNLERPAAAAFLARVRETMVEGDRLLVGIDLRKDREILERAYDDSRGVTARFNLNLLRRINHDLEANFDLAQFRHRVHFDEPSGSVQSFLESQCAQQVRVGGLDLEFSFDAGERIHTEDSHKYSLTEIDDLALEADLQLEKRYFDAKRLFTLNLLQPVG